MTPLHAIQKDRGSGLPTLRMPSDEELHEACSRKWAISGPFNIDQWPSEVLALSMPTTFILADPVELERVYEGDEDVMSDYAARIDASIGWRDHFVRLNSRSPKDAAYPGLPITCAGKQAMAWIAASMRCADDISLHKHARKPLYICLRKRAPIAVEYEFRCFAKDGEMIAISRYDYNNETELGDKYGAKAFEAAKEFYTNHLKEHYKDVVFDLHAPGSQAELLIELNPYGLSDPCLFETYKAVELGGWMIRKREVG